MNNPLQLLQAMKNPQQFLQQMSNNQQIMSNPMAKNAFDMAQRGDAKGIEQMARNICKSKGIDPNDMFNRIKSSINI